jgi:hypothetical protein
MQVTTTLQGQIQDLIRDEKSAKQQLLAQVFAPTCVHFRLILSIYANSPPQRDDHKNAMNSATASLELKVKTLQVT